MEQDIEAMNKFMGVSQELATELLNRNEMNETEKVFFANFTIASLDIYMNKPEATSLFDLLKSAQKLSVELMQKDKTTDLEQRFIRALVKISLAVLLHQKDCSKCDKKEECDKVKESCNSTKH